MKKLILSFVAVLAFFSCAVAQTKETAVDPNAKAILDKAAAKFSSHAGLSSNLKVTVVNNQTNKKSDFKGSLKVKGSKFKLSLSDVDTYYDGKTQYVHLTKEKEVNISTPKEEDMKDTNPIFLLQAYKKGYKMRYEGERKVLGKLVDVVNLYPNDRNKPFSIITIFIDKKTLLPVLIKSKGKNGIDTDVEINDCVDSNIDDSVFVFDTKANKDVEIIDLR